MTSSNLNTAIIATTATHIHHHPDQRRSRGSDILFDVSRETSPLLQHKDHTRPNTGMSNHDHPTYSPSVFPEGCLKICVSGRIFELTMDQVKKYPDSILADPEKMAEYYQPSIGMFFFDRNRFVFEYIMQFLQGDGYMEFPDEVPSQLMEIELEFYNIGHRIVNKTKSNDKEPVITICDKGRQFFNEPGSSIFAKCWMCLDIFFIVISVVIFVLRTEQVVIELEASYSELKMFFWVVTIFCAIFFTVDLGGRLIFCKNKFKFFLGVMPWLDIIAIIPLYIEIFEEYIELGGEMLNILKLFRMARVARCLKLIRRSKKLILIFQILVQCKEELSILLLVWVTGTAISGSIMFYVEESANRELFYSILESCWWAITTIGTIGYGNIQPITALGMMLTSIIIFCSMIFMTVPMTIIIRRFSDSYEKVERAKADVKLFGAVPCGNQSVPPTPPETKTPPPSNHHVKVWTSGRGSKNSRH